MKNIGMANPQWMGAFQKFMQESKKEGSLSYKIKQIIGVALSVKGQCERCITWHVQKAMEAGATKSEILEACFVAVMMGGGPALMYMEDVTKAIEAFSQE